MFADGKWTITEKNYFQHLFLIIYNTYHAREMNKVHWWLVTEEHRELTGIITLRKGIIDEQSAIKKFTLQLNYLNRDIVLRWVLHWFIDTSYKLKLFVASQLLSRCLK